MVGFLQLFFLSIWGKVWCTEYLLKKIDINGDKNVKKYLQGYSGTLEAHLFIRFPQISNYN